MDTEKLPNFPFSYFVDFGPKDEEIHKISNNRFEKVICKSEQLWIVKALKRNTDKIMRNKYCHK